jgi:hypothetical protein
MEETVKKICLNDLDSIRKGTAGSLHDEHVIIANALWLLVSELKFISKQEVIKQ